MVPCASILYDNGFQVTFYSFVTCEHSLSEANNQVMLLKH